MLLWAGTSMVPPWPLHIIRIVVWMTWFCIDCTQTRVSLLRFTGSRLRRRIIGPSEEVYEMVKQQERVRWRTLWRRRPHHWFQWQCPSWWFYYRRRLLRSLILSLLLKEPYRAANCADDSWGRHLGGWDGVKRRQHLAEYGVYDKMWDWVAGRVVYDQMPQNFEPWCIHSRGWICMP